MHRNSGQAVLRIIVRQLTPFASYRVPSIGGFALDAKSGFKSLRLLALIAYEIDVRAFRLSMDKGIGHGGTGMAIRFDTQRIEHCL